MGVFRHLWISNTHTMTLLALQSLYQKVVFEEFEGIEYCDQHGKEALQHFVSTRMVNNTIEFWGAQKKNKFKYFKDVGVVMQPKIKGQLVHIKQERTLLSRLLVIAKTRPEYVVKDAIGNFEFNVTPPSNFHPDGSMIMLSSKSQLVPLIMKMSAPGGASNVVQYEENVSIRVLIIDAMCLVNMAHIDTKAELTTYLSHNIISHYQGHRQKVLVMHHTTMLSNCPLSDIVSMPGMSSGRHSLEEGNQLVLLNACDVMHKDPQSFLDVFSVDTDVFVLLTGHYKLIPKSTTLIRRGSERLSIRESYSTWAEKSRRSYWLLGDTCAEEVPELRWMLFAQKSKEGQGQLPPTLGSLVPHTARAYHMALIWKTSKEPYPLGKYIIVMDAVGFAKRGTFNVFHPVYQLKMNMLLKENKLASGWSFQLINGIHLSKELKRQGKVLTKFLINLRSLTYSQAHSINERPPFTARIKNMVPRPKYLCTTKTASSKVPANVEFIEIMYLLDYLSHSPILYPEMGGTPIYGASQSRIPQFTSLYQPNNIHTRRKLQVKSFQLIDSVRINEEFNEEYREIRDSNEAAKLVINEDCKVL
ncbi:hypothetical protein GQR58_005613 [Nymphon striatum]|nr:hypothetical protein GQR58_005613 [Nymphon striatum]